MNLFKCFYNNSVVLFIDLFPPYLDQINYVSQQNLKHPW